MRSYIVLDMSQKLIHMYIIIHTAVYVSSYNIALNMGQNTYIIILSEPDHIDEPLFVMPGSV